MNLLAIVAAAWQTVVCLDACLQVKERQAATKTVFASAACGSGMELSRLFA